MDQGRPLDLFSAPLDGLLLLGFGYAYWAIATLIVSVSRNESQIREWSRHNPWFVLFNQRSMTADEAAARLSPLFFKIYGAFGRVGQWIGGTLSALGLAGFVVASARSLATLIFG